MTVTLKNRNAFLVMGAPRSGTSVTSNVLNTLGVNFGNKERFLDATQHKHNPIFFEFQWSNDINNSLLKEVNQNWLEHFFLPDASFWQNNLPELRKYIELIKESVYEEWGQEKHQIIGIKDPRISLTYPVWQVALSELGYNVEAVLVYRHPQHCAASNAALNDKSIEYNLPFWIQHNLASIFWIRSFGGHILSYENLTLNSFETVEKLAKCLKLDFNLCEKATEVIDSRLDHQSQRLNAKPLSTSVVRCLHFLQSEEKESGDFEIFYSLTQSMSDALRPIHSAQSELADLHLKNLQKAQTELQQVQAELQQVQTEFQKTQIELQQAQDSWENCQNNIAAIKTSKLWKIRQKWIDLEGYLLASKLWR